MRVALLLFASCGILAAQGTSIPVNAGVMTTITGIAGYQAQSPGFDKCVWVSTRNVVTCIMNYRTAGVTSEAQDALGVYSYADNRINIISQTGAFHSAHGTGTGHNWGQMFHVPSQDAVYFVQSSGSNSPEMNLELWKWDVAGMVISPWTTPTSGGSLIRVWTDNNVIYKAAGYDTTNGKAVFFPNYQGGTGQASICSMTTSACVTSNTTNGISGSADEPAIVFDSGNTLMWIWDGVNIRSLNTSTGNWTAPTTTCTGADCTSGHPQSRQYNAMAYSVTDQTILMMGGWGSGVTRFSDIWKVNVSNPAAPVWTEICATSCGYVNTGANSTFNRLIYDTTDNVFLYMHENSDTWSAYALSTALNYGRTTAPTYAPPSDSINRTVPPSTPTAAATEAYAFDVSAAVSGSDLLVAHVETPPASITGNCAIPTPTIWTSAGGGAHLPAGSVNAGCAAITGQNVGTYPTSHPLVADVGGVKWLMFERHGFGGQSSNSAAFAGTWNGTTWGAAAVGCVAGTCSTNTQFPAALIAAGSTPTAALIEQNNGVPYRFLELRVAQWTGSVWSYLGGVTKLNVATNVPQANSAALAATASNNVAVAFAETNGSDRVIILSPPQIYVKLWNGTAWSQLGGSLNQSSTSFAYTPAIANLGGSWYVAWTERTQTGNANVFVKRWTGSAWTLAGSGSLNINTSTGLSYHPSLAVDGATLYLAWEEQSASGQHSVGHVKSWNGASWSTVGGNIVRDPANGSVSDMTMAVLNTKPTVAFSEQSYGNMAQVYVRQWNGAVWDLIGTPVLNSLTITNPGATTTNYPVQIGRWFAQGEIVSGSLPQVSIDGVAAATQVDVKTRWSDNSLKHAVVSFLVPSFGSGSTISVTFAAGSTVGNTALTQAQMLGAPFNFNAHLGLTKTGVTKGADETYSARTMLTNGDYTVWASGPIATTILLGNHAQGTTCGGNAASTYDFGFDGFCAFRPLFYATFWAGTNQVFVRFIGDLSNSEQLETISVDSMALTVGNTSPTSAYSRATALTMYAASRWTKTAWIGGTPPSVGYNHNLVYLASAKAVPNYDTSKSISGANITSTYATWTAAAKDLYNYGEWDISLSGGGGHSHVGPAPAWNIRWLYTGDIRAQEEALGQADLFSSVEYHQREGKAGKKLDRAGLVNGVGYPWSTSTRPTGISTNYTDSRILAADKMFPVGTISEHGWGLDPAHEPEPFAIPYLLTGDFFYLEEDWFLSSWTSGYLGFDQSTWRARGPTGAEGGLPDKGSIGGLQMRGQAWAFRNRVETAALTPDASPMKAYLELLVADTIAYWEGQRDVTASAFHGNTMWNFGHAVAFPVSGEGLWDSWEGPFQTHHTVHPLHFWDNGNQGLCDDRVNDLTVAKDCTPPWMQDYVIYALGRGKELGYATDALLTFVAPNPINNIIDPTANPYTATTYRTPTIKLTDANFSTYPDVATGYTTATATETDFYPGTIFAGGQGDPNANVQPLSAAVSMISDQPGGTAAWTWVATTIVPNIAGADLKWAILPRASSTATCSLAPTSIGPYTAGQVVSQTFTPSSCAASSCSITAGSLSGSGVALGGTSNCVLSGTAAVGSFSVTIGYDTATDPLTFTVTGTGSALFRGTFTGTFK